MAIPENSLRRSQAVVPFGVGALVDFPDQTLMAAGLDVWPDRPPCQLKEDKRLANRLGVNYFRLPPPAPDSDRNQFGALLPFIRFPQWHFCPRCRLATLVSAYHPQPPRCNGGFPTPTNDDACRDKFPQRRRPRLVPMRQMVICLQGHIDDFPWFAWAHNEQTLGRYVEQSYEAVAHKHQLRLNRPSAGGGLFGFSIQCGLAIYAAAASV